jgi:transcriptional regulator with PAS, ATPase and Fis domain
LSDSAAIVDYDVDAAASDKEDIEEQTLSIQNVSAELIRKALEKHGGKRKLAAAELGISERTLYRKIKELDLDL